TNESTNQPTNQPINQPTNRLTDRPTDRQIDRPATLPGHSHSRVWSAREVVTHAFCIRHNFALCRPFRHRERERERDEDEEQSVILLSLHRIRRAARQHEKVWPIAVRRAIGPRAIGNIAAWGRARRRHVALSLRARQSSARARRSRAPAEPRE
ncbi:putative hemoglobin and hemoglobin-haptoglobin-binding protein 3, partial [Trachymyrmex cornetzi]